MELRELEAVFWVARLRSFSRAADRLHDLIAGSLPFALAMIALIGLLALFSALALRLPSGFQG